MNGFSLSKTLPAKKTKALPFNFSIRHRPTKRLFDILFSLIALTLGFPLYLIISLAILFSSKGNIFYAHERLGRGALPFKCWKFRSMYQDADERLKHILESDPKKKKEWDTTQKLRKDPRITPIGTFLRKLSLDELPQFWNVLKGDLSVVGPRAMIKPEIEYHLGNKASEILSIRPGVTGLWQVSGRSDLSYAHRIRLDQEYVQTQSIRKDIKIIAQTIPVMLFSKGAY